MQPTILNKKKVQRPKRIKKIHKIKQKENKPSFVPHVIVFLYMFKFDNQKLAKLTIGSIQLRSYFEVEKLLFSTSFILFNAPWFDPFY